MQTYSFTLSFSLPNSLQACDDLDERLAEAGLLDGHIGQGLPRRVAVSLDRDAPNAQAALDSALSQIMSALPGAALLEAGPDYVGLSEAAQAFDLSRQALRKHMLHDANFPAAIHPGKPSLWHWADLLAWAQARWPDRVKAHDQELADCVRLLNLECQAKRVGRRLIA